MARGKRPHVKNNLQEDEIKDVTNDIIEDKVTEIGEEENEAEDEGDSSDSSVYSDLDEGKKMTNQSVTFSKILKLVSN